MSPSVVDGPGAETSPKGGSSRPSRCWICGSEDVVRWRGGVETEGLSPEDLRITDGRYGLTLPLAECRSCGFRFAVGDDLAALESLYARLEDPAYSDGSPARARQMEWLVRMAHEDRPDARTALDVGAAAGLLVRAARRAGLEAMGVEPSVSLARIAQSGGLDVRVGVLPHPELEGRRFDLVFLIDVLEHVRDPIDLLRRCRDRMSEKGLLLLVTPNGRSLAARLLGRRWWHYRLAHVGYFDRHTLTSAFRATGLVPVRWRSARWFFPIDYLAIRLERYLPVAGINRIARKVPGIRGLYRLVVPLDLKDSFAVLVRRDDAAS